MVSQISVKYGPPQSDKIDANQGNDGKIYRFGKATWEFRDTDSSEKYGITVDLLPTGFNYFSKYGKSFGYVTIEYAAVSLEERLRLKEY